MDQTTIAQPLKEFIKRTSRSFPVERVILYGSYTKGNATPTSDIDLLVVGRFADASIDDPTQALYMAYQDLQDTHDFHVYGIDSADYATRTDSLTLEVIRKTGKVLYQGHTDLGSL